MRRAQASVVAGFSFESLVELEVPEGTHWLLSSTYFVCGASAMALALYCLVVASFACVFGHRLALQAGTPPRDPATAVTPSASRPHSPGPTPTRPCCLINWRARDRRARTAAWSAR